MPNQTKPSSELQVNLQQFEELAEKFIQNQSELKDELWTTDEEQADYWINQFKNFIFADHFNQLKRKEEYFKLKEQVEKLKAEFEPELPEEDCAANYVKQPETAICVGCCFLTNSNECTRPHFVGYSCEDDNHIWIKKS